MYAPYNLDYNAPISDLASEFYETTDSLRLLIGADFRDQASRARAQMTKAYLYLKLDTLVTFLQRLKLTETQAKIVRRGSAKLEALRTLDKLS
jgi:hypothetical protein